MYTDTCKYSASKDGTLKIRYIFICLPSSLSQSFHRKKKKKTQTPFLGFKNSRNAIMFIPPSLIELDLKTLKTNEETFYV